MSGAAVLIRDAIYDRVKDFWRFGKVSKTSMPSLDPKNTPWAGVFISREVMTPDGQGNAGEPKFVSDVTIAISIVRGFNDPLSLDGSIDQDLADVLSGLLIDPSFVTFGEGCLFESVERIDTRRLFPQQGETYFAELRMEVTFRTRIAYPPDLEDELKRIRVTARPLGHDAGTPSVTVELDQE